MLTAPVLHFFFSWNICSNLAFHSRCFLLFSSWWLLTYFSMIIFWKPFLLYKETQFTIRSNWCRQFGWLFGNIKNSALKRLNRRWKICWWLIWLEILQPALNQSLNIYIYKASIYKHSLPAFFCTIYCLPSSMKCFHEHFEAFSN